MLKYTFNSISSPEFINLEPLDINPLMSKCEIKVFYLGENRNGTYIGKEVALDMAKTLRGAPIVGYYKDTKKDYTDHGDVVTIDDEGFHFDNLTRPYGFVAPDALVWFQKFQEPDAFGKMTDREYLMTTGYLWTGQYEEAKLAVEGEGKPQSMELTDCNGHTARNQQGMDFYIITDATFSKLCILGSDVEPCFEGAQITAPQVSKTFSRDGNDFRQTLFTMMQELQFALEGGKQVEDSTIKKKGASEAWDPAITGQTEDPTQNPQAEATPDANATGDGENQNGGEGEPAVVTEPTEGAGTEEGQNENTDPETNPVTTDPQTPTEPTTGEEGQNTNNDLETDPVTTNPETPAEGEGDPSGEGTGEGGETPPAEEPAAAEGYALLQNQLDALQQEYDALKTNYTALQEQNAELLAFKQEVENAQKDKLISDFYMLSDEDKADVIANKQNYSLEEIESKLSVICVRKRVNFNSDNSSENHNNMKELTYSLTDTSEAAPAWVQAVIDNKNSKN